MKIIATVTDPETVRRILTCVNAVAIAMLLGEEDIFGVHAAATAQSLLLAVSGVVAVVASFGAPYQVLKPEHRGANRGLLGFGIGITAVFALVSAYLLAVGMVPLVTWRRTDRHDRGPLGPGDAGRRARSSVTSPGRGCERPFVPPRTCLRTQVGPLDPDALAPTPGKALDDPTEFGIESWRVTWSAPPAAVGAILEVGARLA